MKITLKNVRGFEGEHKFEIRPLTILIGENSSGKTTLLAAISAVLNNDYPMVENLFNRAPFELGSFDTIATYRGGKFGRAESFSIGWELMKNGEPEAIEATFINDRGVPRLNQITVKNESGILKGQVNQEYFEFQFSLQLKSKSRSDVSDTLRKKTIKFKVNLQEEKSIKWQNLLHYFILDSMNTRKRKDPEHQEVFRTLLLFSSRALGSKPHSTALAPLRTRPRRTYDELNEDFKPEGDHIPLVLERLLQKSKNSKNDYLDALHKFGLASGLFEKIDVKRMGKQPSDPFQVRVKMKGPDANLVDVGYGVSQSLPIVIDSIMAPRNEVLLIQQPEVHLHPKAQAALGTFFVDLAANASKQFVVETHSDYLIDRVRIAVAEGKISENKVQLLFLERKGLDIKVHALKLDSHGNITNAPANYRNFFLEEEMKLMSRAS
jgi:predicted ATPase